MDAVALLPIAIAAALLLPVVGVLLLLKRLHVAVPADRALLVHDARGNVHVARSGRLVLPIGNTAELVDLRTTTLAIQRLPRGFRCLDNIRVTVTARFALAVIPTAEDIALAARRVGASHVADPAALERLFGARLENAMQTALGAVPYAEAAKDRKRLEDAISSAVGNDLEGFALEGVHLGEVAQVPLECLDPSDILDAEAIRIITEQTARENLRTAEMRREMRAQTSALDLAAEEARLRREEQMAKLTQEQQRRIEEKMIEVMKKA
jgi:uncharacterized membrane protein YqiK